MVSGEKMGPKGKKEMSKTRAHLSICTIVPQSLPLNQVFKKKNLGIRQEIFKNGKCPQIMIEAWHATDHFPWGIPVILDHESIL